MADERSCTRTIVALVVAAVTCLSLSLARADQKVRIAYISDSPGSSAPYWIAKEAGLYQETWTGCRTDLHQRQYTWGPKSGGR